MTEPSSATQSARRSAATAARSRASAPTISPPCRSRALMARNPRRRLAGASTTSSTAAPTRPARTTATWRAWRCCWPDCRRASPVRRSTGCAARASMRSRSSRARSAPERSSSSSPAGREHEPRALRDVARRMRAFDRKPQMLDTTIGWRFVNPLMKQHYGVDSMPETAENVAAEFAVSRARPGRVRAAQSAAGAARAGRRPARARRSCRSTIARREGRAARGRSRRASARRRTLEALAKLDAVVRADGTVTAGNSSGVNDGAGGAPDGERSARRSRTGSTPRARIVGARGCRRGAAHHGHRPGARPRASCSRRLGAALGGHRRDRAQRGLRRAVAGRDARARACGRCRARESQRRRDRARAPARHERRAPRGDRDSTSSRHRAAGVRCARCASASGRASRCCSSASEVHRMSELVRVETAGDVAVIVIENPPVNALRSAGARGVAGRDRAARRRSRGARHRVARGRSQLRRRRGPARVRSRRRVAPLLYDVLRRVEACSQTGGCGAARRDAGRRRGVRAGESLSLREPATCSSGFPRSRSACCPARAARCACRGWSAVRQALDMMTSGDPIGLARAIELGIVDQAVGDDVGPRRSRGPPSSRPQARRCVGCAMRRSRCRRSRHRPGSTQYREALPRAARKLPATERIVAVRRGGGEAAVRRRDAQGARTLRTGAVPRRSRGRSGTCSSPSAVRPCRVELRPVASVGVIGSGTMGAGIAISLATGGYSVTLVDANATALEAGPAACPYDDRCVREEGPPRAPMPRRRPSLA